MISSGGYAGGIAALNEGTITGCANESAPVTHNEKATSSYYALAGGIAGQNSGTIALSYNLARVTGGNENIGHIGGIAGKNESAGTIESCYNRGDIQTGAYLGGITGYLSGTATNCYSTGSVPTGTYAKALFGHCTSYSAKATACFYLTGCGPEDTKGTAKTAEEFKTLAASLGGAFADADPYPTLKWQDPNATFTITLTVKPANASVTVTGAASVGTPEVRKNEETNEATYIYSGLNKGSYRWAVTCDDGENDYLKQEGSFTIATSDVTHAVTLAAKTYDVNFIVDPVGADFTLTQGEGEDAKTITPKTAKDKDRQDRLRPHEGRLPLRRVLLRLRRRFRRRHGRQVDRPCRYDGQTDGEDRQQADLHEHPGGRRRHRHPCGRRRADRRAGRGDLYLHARARDLQLPHPAQGL